jgi:L-glutamine-phosphate cytidylyltransferase
VSEAPVARPTRAIIVAAGMGRRLAPYTDEMPKCLVPVRGRPMLARALDAFRAEGVSDFVIVRGYRADVLERRRGELGPGVRFVENAEFRTNNILRSLFSAGDALDGPFLFSYADIVFGPEVVTTLMAAPGDICLVVDRRFADIYTGRTEHPLVEAEVCSVTADGAVALVGKRALPAEQAVGEFIGLAKFSAVGAAAFSAAYRRLASEYAGREDQPFQRAPTWRQAYVTDLLQHLIDAGVRTTPVYIDGRWREIDTVQDLERAEEQVDW